MIVEDWTCEVLPQSSASRARLPPYSRDGPKVVRPLGVTICRAYLQCLLSLDTLRTEEIPHGKVEAVYTIGFLLHDGEVEMEDVPLQDGMLVPAIEHARDVDTTLEDAMAALLEEHNMTSLVLDADDDDDDDDLDLFADMPPSPLLDTAGEGRTMDPTDVASLAAVPHHGRWGIHRIGRKRPSARVKHGGVEAICALHRKSSVTACKKFFKLDNATEEALGDAVHRAKWWLAQAHIVQRQWEHIYVVAAEPLPPLRSWIVKDDDDYYLNLGVLEKPAATRRSRPKALAIQRHDSPTHAEAKAAGKRKARAKPKLIAAPPVSSSSESSCTGSKPSSRTGGTASSSSNSSTSSSKRVQSLAVLGTLATGTQLWSTLVQCLPTSSCSAGARSDPCHPCLCEIAQEVQVVMQDDLSFWIESQCRVHESVTNKFHLQEEHAWMMFGKNPVQK
eukprot:4606566-Amphidinium_carterae.7